MPAYRFKGGPIFQNSGGMGPDDYLLKPVKGGRWYKVIFRWGRHWTGQKKAAVEDREAMKNIFPIQRICVSDMAQRAQRMEREGKLVTLTAAEFWEKYKDKPLG